MIGTTVRHEPKSIVLVWPSELEGMKNFEALEATKTST